MLRDIVESYLKKKKQGMGISYFKIRNPAQDKKNGKQFKHFFSLSVNELHGLLETG